MRAKKVSLLVGAIFVSAVFFSHSAYAAFNISIGSNGTVDLGEITPSPSSGLVSSTAADNVSISTNCLSGYNIYATGTNGSSTDLVNTKHGSTISTSSNTIASPAALANNTWGLVAGSTATGSGSIPGLNSGTPESFSGLPAYTTDFSTISPIYTAAADTTSTIRNDNIPVYYGIKVNTDTTPGNYTASVLYTTVMNDVCLRYTLKFDGNSATTNNLTTQTVSFGSNVDLASFSSTDKIARTGYRLSGWKIKIGDTTSETVYPIDTNMVLDDGISSEVTLIAQWEADTYTITYAAGDATISSVVLENTSTSAIITSGSNVAYNTGVTAICTSNTGYHCSWTSSNTTLLPNSSDASYSFNMPAGAIDLIAFGAANTYTIKYNANAPSGTTVSGFTSDTSDAAYDTTISLRENGYTVSGYDFKGWAYSSSAASADFTGGQTDVSVSGLASNNASGSVTNINNATITLYAVWKVRSHTVSITPGANITSTTGGGTYNVGQTVTISATASSGYTFSSWTVNSGGISLSNTTPTSFRMPDADVVITANSTVDCSAAICCSSTISPGTTADGACKMPDNNMWAIGNNGETILWRNLCDGNDNCKSSTYCPSGFSIPSKDVYQSLLDATGNGGLIFGHDVTGYFWSSTLFGTGKNTGVVAVNIGVQQMNFVYNVGAHSNSSLSLYNVLCYKPAL